MHKAEEKGKTKRTVFMLAAICIVVGMVLGACGVPNAANTSGAADKFLGEWQDETGKVILDVWKEDSGTLHGEICETAEENRVLSWSFTGTAGGNTFTYGECTYRVVTYDADWDATEEVVYTGGTGKLTRREDTLVWKDDQRENTGEFVLSHVGEY